MSPRTIALLVLFFLSGATGLVYEVLWTRQLALIFGVTTYAVSTVLATYMGGLALGSWLMGRVVDRVSNPLAMYAALEVGIGLYALVVSLLLHAVRPLYIGLAHLELSYPVFSLVRSAMAAAVLLVPTTMMGGTFPTLVRHWVREGGGMHRGTGILYFTNTAGAILGCGLAGFVLLERFGLGGTTHLAAFTNVALACAAFVLSRGRSGNDGESPAEAAAAAQAPLSPAASAVVLGAAALSGFVSLSAQVLWSRGLLRYLYNSTYAFTAMLAVFLVGITVGSALFTTLLARRRRPMLVLALLQAATAVGFGVSAWVFPRIPDLTVRAMGTGAIESFDTAVTMMLVRAALVLLPPVVMLGAMFPLATVLYASGRRALGRAVGHVYAANTFGAILGSVGAAFVTIPKLGMWGTHRLLVASSLVGAAVVAFAGDRGSRAGKAVAAASLAAAAWVVAVPGFDVFRGTFVQHPGHELDFYAEGPTDTVGVVRAFGQRTIVYEDQRGTASTWSYGVNLFLGHLPVMLHPGTPKKVLHICFGVGNSLDAVASHPEVERVDSVELSPHVLEAAPLFWTNDGVVSHPKVRHVIDDGRNFLMTTSEQYDVILLEPPETFTAGVINLYTVEFYRDALARLAPGGVMMQWIPTANGTVQDEKDLFRAFDDVFPHATMWWQLDGGCALLVGTREPLTIDYGRLRAHWNEGRVAQDMALSQLKDVDHLLAFFVFDDAAFAEFARDGRPTEDDHTVLDFSMPRFAGSGFGLGQFNRNVKEDGKDPFNLMFERRAWYLSQRRPVLPLLTGLGDEPPDVVAARIENAKGHRFVQRPFLEPEWREMRQSGAIPDMTPRRPKPLAVPPPATAAQGAPAPH